MTRGGMLLTQSVDDHRSIFVKIDGVDLAVELRRSYRARRFTLKVSHTERAAILTLPDRGRLDEAGDFLARHFDWLKRQIEKLPQPVALSDGATIPLRGISHRLVFVGPSRRMGVVWVEADGDASPLSLSLGDGLSDGASQTPCHIANGTVSPSAAICHAIPRLCVAGAYDHAARRLVDWLKVEARKDITHRVNHHAAALGLAPRRISVRDQATRWGSCSSTGNLSFSWRLIFAPAFVLDYVAAHEVAHLRELNHGPRFWRLVRDLMPEMHKARAWLKQNGAELHRYHAQSSPPSSGLGATIL